MSKVKAVETIEAVEVDLDSIEEGEWFFYQNSYIDKETEEPIFGKPSPHAKVRVRRMQPLIQEKVLKRKKVAEYVLNTKSREMERKTHYKDQTWEEEQKEIDDMWDYVITGLECFKNKKTKEFLECTRENKLKLMMIPAFDRFIGHCLKILEGAEVEKAKATAKN
jgi:hypothetical protein